MLVYDENFQVNKKSFSPSSPSSSSSSPSSSSCSPTTSRASNVSISRINVANITDSGSCQSLSTSAVLSACKRKILSPYLKLLAVIGFKGFGSDGPNVSKILLLFNYVHLLQVIIFTCAGYVLQYVACFRRDRGFSCDDHGIKSFENAAFGFILPSTLHFFGCAYVFYLFRFKGTEQLEKLMERTFLLSANRTNGRNAYFVKRLWIFIYVSMLWVILSLFSVALLLQKDNYKSFEWIHSFPFKILFEVVLALTIVWQDIVQATIITSYCLQVLLLSASLYFLREKLLQHTIEPLSWIREINECQNVLNYLNHDFSPAVCIFIFINVSGVISCAISFFKIDDIESKISLTIVIALWLAAALAPFVLAAHLTSACMKLRHLGHEVRIRPFVYQDTPGEELDTILLYTATLRMKSKLFAIPISGPYLCAFFALVAMSVLVAGQSGFF